MPSQHRSRRHFIKSTLLGTAAAATNVAALAATPSPTSDTTRQTPEMDPVVPTYVFLTPGEAEFVEALVDHMVPADRYSPKGSDLGINIYIDKALAGSWGTGDRLYLDGPWKAGLPGQGYQLPLAPFQLFRSATAAFDAHLKLLHQVPFSMLSADLKEQVIQQLACGKTDLGIGIPANLYFDLLYQLVNEGFFADPVHGGNADKAGWKMLGFPGVIATHTNNLARFHDKPYPHIPLGIADAS